MRQRIAVTCAVRKRYRKSAKKKKSEILSEFVATTGYNRSYARLVLGSFKKQGRKPKYPPRKRVYDISVFYPLRKLWLTADCICGQRLKPFIPELISVLEKKGEMKLGKEVKKKLCHIGSATIDRLLKATRKQYELRGRTTTKPGTLLKHQIPIRTFSDWDENKPGFLETDTVSFGGGNTSGHFVWGLDMTDVFTGWTLLAAVMGRGQERIHQAVKDGRDRLPFPLLGLDSDSGGEFINDILFRYCKDEGITFTRNRPGKKNDNCYVEQKNYTTLRRFLGYGRYDTDEQLTIIKEILSLAEPYINFFQPVMKLKTKERIGSRVKKTYDTARTPYRRLIDSGILDEEQKQKLSSYYESLNPVDLKRRINKLLQKLNKTLR